MKPRHCLHDTITEWCPWANFLILDLRERHSTSPTICGAPNIMLGLEPRTLCIVRWAISWSLFKPNSANNICSGYIFPQTQWWLLLGCLLFFSSTQTKLRLENIALTALLIAPLHTGWLAHSELLLLLRPLLTQKWMLNVCSTHAVLFSQ